MRIAVVTPAMKSGERGGAENFYEGLVKALNAAGYEATQVNVQIDESDFDHVLESYCKCFYLDLNEYDMVISTKAPTYMIRHRNHVSYLLHTVRIFYDMFETDMGSDPEKLRWRKIVHALDKYGLDGSRIKKHATIGKTVADRMKDADPFWEDIDFEVIHPAPLLRGFEEPREGEFIFLPGRLHRWKRIDLAIRAMEYVRKGVKLVISGQGEEELNLKALAIRLGMQDRIDFLGSVSDEKLLDLYSRAIAVPFLAKNEDFGYVTIEAFLAKKPVITCKDSGEASYLVKDGISGFVVDPDPKQIAEKINYLIDDPTSARALGEGGYASAKGITWENTVSRLMDGMNAEPPAERPEVKVLVTDMQPIEPALGGGRLRLKGLYFNFPPHVKASYIGTYDWKGEKYRHIPISGSLTETTIPLSDEHFRLNDHINTLIPGKVIIDLIFPLLVEASPEYLEAVYNEALRSDVIIFSHPWLYPSLATRMDLSKKTIIYDSQNVESVLRESILGDSAFARCIVQQVRFVEQSVCQAADMIAACSEVDKGLFVKTYGVDPDKIMVIPNGVDVKKIMPPTPDQRSAAKEHYGIEGRSAIFVASMYQPNVEAGRFIVDTLADECKDITFLIVGGVGEALDAGGRPNVRIFGMVPDEDKNRLLRAADIGINPMFVGSGTNIKMFDFLATGLPTITTPVGARGIDGENAFVVTSPENFTSEIRRVLSDGSAREKLSEAGFMLARERYDWNRISYGFGSQISDLYMDKAPFFSIVIPTIRGVDYIGKLFRRLNNQTFKDFEVILVDTSGQDNEMAYRQLSQFTIKYIAREKFGPGRARNTGIRYARGSVIAFTDDDCLPRVDWLEMARKYFNDLGLAGLEGYISTDEEKLDDPAYRTITNKGFESIGFMTANLFIRRDVLKKIGGFDERFQRAFREDSDLAWRALAYGTIPFGRDVEVYHPPHSRSISGESSDSRDELFSYDALLFAKNPEQFIKLARIEGHYLKNQNYWKYFFQGYLTMPEKGPLKLILEDPDLGQSIPEELRKTLVPEDEL